MARLQHFISRYLPDPDPYTKEKERKLNLPQGSLANILHDVMGMEATFAIARYTGANERSKGLARGEVGVFTLERPRLAALLYGRVWSGVAFWDPKAPPELLFSIPSHCAWDVALHEAWIHSGGGSSPEDSIRYVSSKARQHYEPGFLEDVEGYNARYRCKAAVVLSSSEALKRKYRKGEKNALLFKLSSVELIDEAKLTWRQVLSVRKDEQAVRAIDDFLLWSDQALTGKSEAEMQDKLSEKHEEYRTACKKHAVRTALGVAGVILPFIPLAGIAGLQGATFALASGAVQFGPVALDFRERRENLAARPFSFFSYL